MPAEAFLQVSSRFCRIRSSCDARKIPSRVRQSGARAARLIGARAVECIQVLAGPSHSVINSRMEVPSACFDAEVGRRHSDWQRHYDYRIGDQSKPSQVGDRRAFGDPSAAWRIVPNHRFGRGEIASCVGTRKRKAPTSACSLTACRGIVRKMMAKRTKNGMAASMYFFRSQQR